jgi:hypothetical protein
LRPNSPPMPWNHQKTPGYCWSTYFKVLGVLFSWGSILSFFAFKDGILDTQIAARGG